LTSLAERPLSLVDAVGATAARSVAMSPDAMHQYFNGERSAGVLLAALGLAALAFSAWLRADGGAMRAMLYPLALVGVLQLAVGVGLAAKTGAQVAAIEQATRVDGPAARARETDRMARVQQNFVVIELVEVAIVLGGLAMTMLSRRYTLAAIGLGLLIQGSVMLAFDVFADRRGALYYAWLRG
jgi:hypothetical protein